MVPRLLQEASEKPGDADLWPPSESLSGPGFKGIKTTSPPFSIVG